MKVNLEYSANICLNESEAADLKRILSYFWVNARRAYGPSVVKLAEELQKQLPEVAYTSELEEKNETSG